MHSLLREVPGFSQYLHAYGIDNEAAAAFQNAHGLLCYIHIKKNIACKLQKLGLSDMAREEILRDIFSKPKGSALGRFLSIPRTSQQSYEEVGGP